MSIVKQSGGQRSERIIIRRGAFWRRVHMLELLAFAACGEPWGARIVQCARAEPVERGRALPPFAQHSPGLFEQAGREHAAPVVSNVDTLAADRLGQRMQLAQRERFADELDRALQRVNSDYEAKRFRDTTLLRPTLTVAPQGTFYRWMKNRGKAGGQNKVPRLCNDRTYLDQLTGLL